MVTAFIQVYIWLSVIVAVADFYVAIRSFRHKKIEGVLLGGLAVSAIVVDLIYLMSVLSKSKLMFSIYSSLYFISMDFLLLFFLGFVDAYSRIDFLKKYKKVFKCIVAYIGLEIIIFLINPFVEISIGYVQRNDVFARFAYVMHPLYYCHLAFSYGMLVVAVGFLLYKQFSVPQFFRLQYFYVNCGVIFLALINAVFLFLKGDYIYNLVDYSILGYSVVLLIMYWVSFSFAKNQLMKNLSISIFDSIGQGILFFDHEGYLLMNNGKAQEMFPFYALHESLTFRQFASDNSIVIEDDANDSTLQCMLKNKDEEIHSTRLDYHRMSDNKNKTLGVLLVFTDTHLETDLMTGFYNWENFVKAHNDENHPYQNMHTVAIFDINHLDLINNTQGHEAGDKAIKALADKIREKMPAGTLLIRGFDAKLISVTFEPTERELSNVCRSIVEELEQSIEFALASVNESTHDVLDAIRRAEKSLQNKKLLNRESSHSQMLTSLVQALHECDSDTEQHVQRTRHNGIRLADRLGLSDVQKSDLSLLCLLHDIGKIGIPLEILNKPGKLSNEEWEVIQTHVEKGCQIAKSSKELEGISEMIRYHHERWDGRGYPDGLSRETIPILSRVISVIDAFDAMIYDRAYRKALPVETALEELKTNAGTQFDPSIVAEFVQMIQEDPAMKQRIETERSGQVVTENIPEENQTASSGSLDRPEENYAHKVFGVQFSKYVLDKDNRIISVDDYFEKMTHYTREDVALLGLSQSDLIPEEDLTEYLVNIEKQLNKSGFAYVEHRLKRKDGTIRYVFCYGKMYYDSASKSNRSEILITDCTSTHALIELTESEKLRSRKQLEHWEETYRRDSLTGLLNHSAFMNDVEQYLISGRYKVVLLMFDVDHFKEYNDTYGHSAGDDYLKLVAQTLDHSLRDGDLACRMGGDEFAAALFFPIDAKEESIKLRAKQIHTTITTKIGQLEGSEGISMGVSIASEEKNTFRELYEESDQAMYYAKNHGRNRVMMAGEME